MATPLSRAITGDKAELHLRKLLAVLRKRIWVIGTVFIVVVTAVVLRTFLMAPVYEATAVLLIEKEESRILDFEEVVALDSRGSDYYNTQYRILQSRSLVRSVIDDLKLMERPEFRAPGRLGQPWTDKELNVAVDRFLRALRIRPVEKSRLVNVSFRSTDPALAESVANTLGENFIKQDLDTKYLASQAAVDWLHDRLRTLREKVTDSETALQQYQEEQMVISFEERREIVNQKLKELNESITETRTERLKTDALYREMLALADDPEAVDTIPAVLNNGLIQDLKAQRVSLQATLEELEKKYGEKHPEIIKVNDQLARLDREIKAQVGQIIDGVQTERRILQSQENALLDDLEKQKQEVAELNRKLIRYSELERNVESERAILSNLLNRSQETSVSVDLKNSHIRIVDKAELPRRPVKPRKLFDIQMAVLLGLALGCGGALFLEYMDERIRTPEEVKEIIKRPVLGSIPLWKGDEKKGKPLVPTEVTLKNPVGEALRMVRVRISSHCSLNGDNSLLITGTAPGCGKTFVSSNLAVFLAIDKKRTLLIDGDLRKPTLHKVFGLTPEKGLADYLVEEDVSPRSIIQRFKEWPYLFFIPGGRSVPNPSELLGSTKMHRFLEGLKNEFEIVMIDSPPLLAVSDPSVLVQTIDGVLLVAESGRTTSVELNQCLEVLEQGSSALWGVVINKVSPKDRHYPYYSYYHHYSSRKENRNEKSHDPPG